jgi:hypothetical protein
MKAGWTLGILFSVVLGFAGVCQTGVLGYFSDNDTKITSRPVTLNEVFNTEAGWRYQRGQPSHWKFMMMNK